MLPTRTKDEQTRITADYMPNGKHLAAKRMPSRNMYKWFAGLSGEFARMENALNAFADGWNITKSTGMLPQWEKATGIPDQNFSGRGTPIERQKGAIAKLAAEGVSTKADLEWLCSLMGFHVEVYPGHYFWLNPNPLVGSFSSEKESRFTIVFEVDFFQSDPEVLPTLFPITFPWVFGPSVYNSMRGFMLDIIPANCNARWISKQFGYIEDIYTSTDEIHSIHTATDEIINIGSET